MARRGTLPRERLNLKLFFQWYCMGHPLMYVEIMGNLRPVAQRPRWSPDFQDRDWPPMKNGRLLSVQWVKHGETSSMHEESGSGQSSWVFSPLMIIHAEAPRQQLRQGAQASRGGNFRQDLGLFTGIPGNLRRTSDR